MLLLLRVGISDQTLHLTPPPPPFCFTHTPLPLPPFSYPPPPTPINNNKYALHWRRRDTNTLPGKSRENSKIWFGNKTWSQYFISHTIHALFCLFVCLFVVVVVRSWDLFNVERHVPGEALTGKSLSVSMNPKFRSENGESKTGIAPTPAGAFRPYADLPLAQTGSHQRSRWTWLCSEHRTSRDSSSFTWHQPRNNQSTL